MYHMMDILRKIHCILDTFRYWKCLKFLLYRNTNNILEFLLQSLWRFLNCLKACKINLMNRFFFITFMRFIFLLIFLLMLLLLYIMSCIYYVNMMPFGCFHNGWFISQRWHIIFRIDTQFFSFNILLGFERVLFID